MQRDWLKTLKTLASANKHVDVFMLSSSKGACEAGIGNNSQRSLGGTTRWACEAGVANNSQTRHDFFMNLS